MPRGVDTRWDPTRRPDHISDSVGLAYRMANEAGAFAGYGYDTSKQAARHIELEEVENMMSEHPTGMPTPKVRMKDKGMRSRPGATESEVMEGSLKRRVDPSIKKK